MPRSLMLLALQQRIQLHSQVNESMPHPNMPSFAAKWAAASFELGSRFPALSIDLTAGVHWRVLDAAVLQQLISQWYCHGSSTFVRRALCWNASTLYAHTQVGILFLQWMGDRSIPTISLFDD